jgi:alpha-glucosidase (family GH31 glycosyl hydrolase)
MLDKHLLVATRPQANAKNIVCWGNYRITVLQDRLFRLEYSENRKFRDEATQAVWYRDMPAQEFSLEEKDGKLYVSTSACTLLVAPKRKDCRVLLNGKELKIDNAQNLMGTYRTLDRFDGKYYKYKEECRKIQLGTGVCSRSGVAVFNDEKSLALGEEGALLPTRGDGSDEYVFAYGDDYRSAVNALYILTGKAPMIPRFALGNWWSRYHIYTDKEYLRLLNYFEEQDVPLTVATIDMDWHYSNKEENERLFAIEAQGRMNTEYIGALNTTWTGYTWNKRLFPDYKAFLNKIKEKNLKITLNLHPADGIRFWEQQYEDMANAVGIDPTEGKYVPFDIANETFVNAYFKILHKPYEEDGVAFWWIDWQQGTNSKMEGLDPLWALNHYHYLDNALNHSTPLILSRYCGVGSHRYPLGFSGDTFITWDTLDYLPQFTATASNVGYTWWSHDIGGHFCGEKEDEMYARHIQFGVFSPINRLHCSNSEVCTKEPWAYRNGTGEIAKNFLRFRHRLIPYLYTASYRTHKKGLSFGRTVILRMEKSKCV